MTYAKDTSVPVERSRAEIERLLQRWRALALVIKAKLEAVQTGITSFEEEFLAHIVLPDGGTVGDRVTPLISQMYATQKMLPLLPLSPEKP